MNIEIISGFGKNSFNIETYDVFELLKYAQQLSEKNQTANENIGTAMPIKAIN